VSHTVRLAGFFTRAVALVADAAIVTGVTLLVEAAVALALGLFGVSFSSTPVRAALGTGGWLILVGAYFVSFWTLTGETPGMRFLSIGVVALGGGKPTWTQSLRRFIGMLVCALPVGAGFLLVLVDARRRGLHDRLARTLVVHQAWQEPAAELIDSEVVVAAEKRALRTSTAQADRPQEVVQCA
jgi:uncharacterized RDD family membrane protein YckC